MALMGDTGGACRILVGKPEGKRQLGRPTRRWEHNIKMDLKEIRWKNADWINLVQDRDKWRDKNGALPIFTEPFKSPVVSICTTSLTLTLCTFRPHTVFMCFVWI